MSKKVMDDEGILDYLFAFTDLPYRLSTFFSNPSHPLGVKQMGFNESVYPITKPLNEF